LYTLLIDYSIFFTKIFTSYSQIYKNIQYDIHIILQQHFPSLFLLLLTRSFYIIALLFFCFFLISFYIIELLFFFFFFLLYITLLPTYYPLYPPTLLYYLYLYLYLYLLTILTNLTTNLTTTQPATPHTSLSQTTTHIHTTLPTYYIVVYRPGLAIVKELTPVYKHYLHWFIV
jgi:hypothetical protein